MKTQLITLRASAAQAPGTETSDAIVFNGRGQNPTPREAMILLDVTAAATTSGHTLDVYIDTSPDGGTTWVNIGHFTQVLGDGGAKKFAMALRGDNPGASAVVDATSDAAAGVTRQWGICDRLRARGIVNSGGAFTYSVKALLK